MRSPAEIAFRLRQEVFNLQRYLRPPVCPLREPIACRALLPDPARSAALVRGTTAETELLSLAEEILAHRFPLFGTVVETGPQIDWQRDYRSGERGSLDYFRQVPYLDFARVGDHKWTWELNRHQHLIVLAQAFALTGETRFTDEIAAQILSWIGKNPFVRGMNWASALEVAFRALSWIWVDHVAGNGLNADTRRMLQNALWLHAKHLELNLSKYFSPNTHLLGEAVALHAIGTAYPDMPGAAGFARIGGKVTEAQLDFQMHADGSHFEQSTYYQVYAVDFFVLYYLLAAKPAHMLPYLKKMAQFLDGVCGPSRRLFFLGDDDGGRLFHPYGDRSKFARATLATCAAILPDLETAFAPEDASGDTLVQAAWWLGEVAQPKLYTARSKVFPDSGLISLVAGETQVLFDAGPFGWAGAGHSHADTLQIVMRRGDDAILGDPGTFVYTADANARDWFRGTAAHNTVVIDGQDQAIPGGSFRWEDKPGVRLLRSGENFADAECEYRGLRHRRTVLLCNEETCIVLDRISAITGMRAEQTVQQVWNGPMATSAPQAYRAAWRSDCYGSRTAIQQTVASLRGRLPLVMAAATIPEETVTLEGNQIRAGNIVAVFPEDGEPSWSMT